MTSHELAAKLLEQEDKPVVVSDEGDYSEIKSVEQTGCEQFIRLLRIA